MQLITTVVDQAGSYDLTTLANVKAELSITVTTSDSVLRRYITSASAAASQYANRVFVVEGVQDQFLARHNSRLFRDRPEILQLSRWPISELDSVVVDGTTFVDGTDFLTDSINGQLTRIDAAGNRIAWCGQSIVVNYEGGFDTIPPDVQDAIIRMVTVRYLAKGRDLTIRQENIPGVIERQYWVATGSDSGNMTPDVTDVLDNYRTPTLA